jgi:hypothetical protein
VDNAFVRPFQRWVLPNQGFRLLENRQPVIAKSHSNDSDPIDWWKHAGRITQSLGFNPKAALTGVRRPQDHRPAPAVQQPPIPLES